MRERIRIYAVLPVATQEQPRTLSESVVIHFLRARESHWKKSNIGHREAIKAEDRTRGLRDQEKNLLRYGVRPAIDGSLCHLYKIFKLLQQTIS